MAMGNLDAKQLSMMRKEDLIKLAEDMGLDTSSAKTKADYIAIITAVPVEYEPEDGTENVENPTENPPENVIDPAMEALKAQNEMLQRQMEEMQRQLVALQKPQVIQVAADTERVFFLWQADVADYNLVTFGPGGMYGSITGKTGTFSVPKNELSRILNDKTRRYIEKRWLIVVDGLTDEERESLGVDYKDGEILDRKVFSKMVELSKDEICAIFPRLCDSHKEMVGRRYYEEYQKRNEAVTREKVIALRNLARETGLEIKAFKQILLEMNATEEEE